jgi:hypothetical protein
MGMDIFRSLSRADSLYGNCGEFFICDRATAQICSTMVGSPTKPKPFQGIENHGGSRQFSRQFMGLPPTYHRGFFVRDRRSQGKCIMLLKKLHRS